MERELSKLTPMDYSNALLTQNACNVSGLAISLGNLMPRVWNSIRENDAPKGVTHPDRHPIVKLFIYQMAFLTKLTSGGEEFNEGMSWTECYEYCKARSLMVE